MRTHTSQFKAAASLAMMLATGAFAQEPAATAPSADSVTKPAPATQAAATQAEISETAASESLDSKRSPGPKNSAFTIHPILSMLVRGLHVSYEGPIGNDGKTAFEIPVYLGYSERVFDNPTLFTGSGFGIRRYLTEAGKGTYISPEIEIVNVHRFESGEDSSSNYLIVAPTVRMGYKWRWEIFTMEAGAGAAFIYGRITSGRWQNEENNMKGLFPFGHFALGIPI